MKKQFKIFGAVLIVCLFILVGQANAFYFKINKTGIGERKGLVEIRYDLFLDPDDYNYDKHYVQVPVIPEGGYPGEKNAMGMPVDETAYNDWIKALPVVWQNNPFCCHFYQFPSTVTDEEILLKGDEVLDMAYKNWQDGDLHKNKNPHITFPFTLDEKQKSKNRINTILGTDFTTLNKTGKYKIK